jgi:hypothetical protein
VENRFTRPLSFVAGLYLRPIDITEFFDHLTFVPPTSPLSDAQEHYMRAFEEQFKRYLSCRGHPNSAKGRSLVGDAAFQRDADDRTLRARLLLGAVYDEQRLPVNPFWMITVC